MLAFFEEVGWRAWMLPRLVTDMGARRAVVISAVIWAIWHAPFALSGIQHLEGIPAALAAVIMPLIIVGPGLVIGWLWLRTESIWMIALAHGALNDWGQYAFKFMASPGQPFDAVVIGAGGLAVLAMATVLVTRCLPIASPLPTLRPDELSNVAS
jgi:membrane protease YdiL (CAAX protease family)